MLKSIFGEEIVFEVPVGGFDSLADDFFERKSKEEKGITTIVAHSRDIAALPASIRLLSNTLTKLDLDHNCLRHIPSCIYHMPLAHLSLRNNNLTKIEPEIVHMRKLSVLNLQGNPLAYPPLHVACSMKVYKLMEWMQKHPSYETFRMYYGENEESVSYVDLNVSTAHAQVKSTKKNEDRWSNNIILENEMEDEVQVNHVDLDKASTMKIVQGNFVPNSKQLNVYRTKAGFFGMFDGHGGNAASAALQQNMLKLVKNAGLTRISADDEEFDWDTTMKDLFKECDDKLCDALSGLKTKAGSTCTVGLIIKGKTKVKLVMAHVGDSRAIAALNTGNPVFKELTKDHSPHDPEEKLQVEARGGVVARKNPKSCLRVNGDLNMTRSMGDIKWKRPEMIISCVPDVTVYELDPSIHSIIIATDGLWNYFNNEMGANYAKSHPTAEEGASSMVTKIKGWIEGTSHKGDNTSVTVVNLKWGKCRTDACVTESE